MFTEIQAAFDADWAAGFINQSGWSVNASDNGVIGYKLLLQTGNPDDPHNESQVGHVIYSEALPSTLIV